MSLGEVGAAKATIYLQFSHFRAGVAILRWDCVHSAALVRCLQRVASDWDFSRSMRHTAATPAPPLPELYPACTVLSLAVKRLNDVRPPTIAPVNR